MTPRRTKILISAICNSFKYLHGIFLADVNSDTMQQILFQNFVLTWRERWLRTEKDHIWSGNNPIIIAVFFKHIENLYYTGPMVLTLKVVLSCCLLRFLITVQRNMCTEKQWSFPRHSSNIPSVYQVVWELVTKCLRNPR